MSHGGLISRREVLNVTFDGQTYQGYAGDTLASALLAAGVRLFGRSFKYHRPRGILSAGSEEPNALLELRTGARREPNTRATMIELYEGLTATSQNRWPSLTFDCGAVNSLFAPFLAAGFYYKTLMWPAALWEKVYEPLIRRAAGLGRASSEPDPDHYEGAHAFCDVLVIGAGPAGLSAALAAARSGARVILCDEDFLPGGRLNSERRQVGGMSGSAWAEEVIRELLSLPKVRVLKRTTVFGLYDGNTFGAVERVADHLHTPGAHRVRQRLWKIVAKQSVLAAGAIERPIVFGGNDRPGVMTASAMRTYINRFAVSPGRNVALFTATDDGWTTAFDLATAGVDLQAIIDVRHEVSPALLCAAQRAGARVMLGACVTEAQGRRGVRQISVRDQQDRNLRLDADALAVSGGWNPAVSLTTHLGGRASWSAELSAFVPGSMPGGMGVAGAARGTFNLADVLREGATVGAELASATGHTPKQYELPAVDQESTGSTAFWYVAESTGKAFVDFQNDVTVEDVALAAREGFRSPELFKRYTTLGMATDQGKTANLNGLAILAEFTGRGLSDLGGTVIRPPYVPVALGAFAGHHRGRNFRPTRLPPSHHWAQGQGATFIEAGQWLRAQWFARADERDWLETVTREVNAVRQSVGVCDVSTLGKIDVQGPDAARFLDRIYCNTLSTLPVGKTRYGLMLREDGFVMDDGTAAHISPRHYLISTTTMNAARVMQHLEHARQLLWTDLDVQIVSVTEQWAQYSIAGPNSRRLLERLLHEALDVSNESFPYLACAEFLWSGIRARLFRVSFSGELAYELAVPARYGDAAIRAIMTAGADWKIVPYGTEALGVMRIEKGHIAGNEINGTTTPADLGLGRMMSMKKDFVGRVLARRPGLTDPDRAVLVGVRCVDPSARIKAGAHFLARGAQPKPEHDEGYLTSVAFSPSLQRWIGLGLLKRGTTRSGETIRAYDPVRGADTEVEVCSPVFLDPDGARVRA
jgi:methylglutamate dehydrogenase subunit C